MKLNNQHYFSRLVFFTFNLEYEAAQAPQIKPFLKLTFAFCAHDSVCCSPRIRLCWDSTGLCGLCSPHPSFQLQLAVVLFRAEGGRKKSEGNWKDSERKWRSTGLCPGSFPRVAVLSLQQRRSVALCVAQWFLNMCPSRSNSSLRRPPNKHTFWTSFFCPFPPLPSILLSPSHPLRFISMADGLCRAVGIQYFHDVSQTHLGLNILFTSSQHSENHNNTELRQKFRTHYSLFRSQPRSKSSPLLCHDVFRKQSLLLLLFSQSIGYMFWCHALWANLPAATSETVMVVHKITELKKKKGAMWYSK